MALELTYLLVLVVNIPIPVFSKPRSLTHHLGLVELGPLVAAEFNSTASGMDHMALELTYLLVPVVNIPIPVFSKPRSLTHHPGLVELGPYVAEVPMDSIHTSLQR
jgi:hypothetical protein